MTAGKNDGDDVYYSRAKITGENPSAKIYFFQPIRPKD
jgi:hypothetical protein